MVVHSKFLAEYKQSCDELYISYQLDMHRELRESKDRECKVQKIEAEKIRKGGVERDATEQS